MGNREIKKIHKIEIKVVGTFMDIDGYFHFSFYFVDRANSVEDWATIMRDDGTVWIAADVENSEIMQAVKDSHYPQKISMDLIKQLRDRTGAGLLDCKAALLYNDEDLDKAQEWLRDKMFRPA